MGCEKKMHEKQWKELKVSVMLLWKLGEDILKAHLAFAN